MMFSRRFFFFVLALSTTASGFFTIVPTSAKKNVVGKPAVEEFAKIHDKILLNLQLDITGEDNEGHFPLNGLQLELLQDQVGGDHPALPGANSKHASLSTGARSLRVTKDASFVGMNGMQYAQLENSCWEMTWREGDPSGALVCGFDVPTELKRNANSPTLPSGRVYINLRLWNKDGLERMRKWREAAEANHNKEMEKRHEELEKMQQTNNLFMKALHRGKSLAALDRAMATGVEGLIRDVPLDDKLIMLDGGLGLRSDGYIIFDGEADRSIIGKALVLPGLRP